MFLEPGDIMIGVDECGWGPLAGPIVVCAVAMRVSDFATSPCKDSKKYKHHIDMYRDLKRTTVLAHAVYEAWPKEIVEKGPSGSLRECYKLAIETVRYQLRPRCPKAILDGSTEWYGRYVETLIKADSKFRPCSVASCFAKTRQVEIMLEWQRKYPEYGFHSHHGYGSQRHIAAIKKHGMIPAFHRIPIIAKMQAFRNNPPQTRKPNADH